MNRLKLDALLEGIESVRHKDDLLAGAASFYASEQIRKTRLLDLIERLERLMDDAGGAIHGGNVTSEMEALAARIADVSGAPDKYQSPDHSKLYRLTKTLNWGCSILSAMGIKRDAELDKAEAIYRKLKDIPAPFKSLFPEEWGEVKELARIIGFKWKVDRESFFKLLAEACLFLAERGRIHGD